jgi:hypothetical protein
MTSTIRPRGNALTVLERHQKRNQVLHRPGILLEWPTLHWATPGALSLILIARPSNHSCNHICLSSIHPSSICASDCQPGESSLKVLCKHDYTKSNPTLVKPG